MTVKQKEEAGTIQINNKEGVRKMFERIDYFVRRIDGDYAYLQRAESEDEELKCVAMALLPPEVMEGSRIAYEMLQYSMAE